MNAPNLNDFTLNNNIRTIHYINEELGWVLMGNIHLSEFPPVKIYEVIGVYFMYDTNQYINNNESNLPKRVMGDVYLMHFDVDFKFCPTFISGMLYVNGDVELSDTNLETLYLINVGGIVMSDKEFMEAFQSYALERNRIKTIKYILSE